MTTGFIAMILLLLGACDGGQEPEAFRHHPPPITASGAPIAAKGAFSCDFVIDFENSRPGLEVGVAHVELG
ncbi:hypothetical protein ENSA7_71310 [Enhygromyxa salina]|uniref:Uncharacterized protein n=1 Tax=Enhygromyxa salina TaxID=215803 RepID=A0A2S9XTX5_9BACT|nr:hypothetical protein ENSA7_71310 [Enhygromyxa salina]